MFLKVLEISYNTKAAVRGEIEFLVERFERQVLFIFYFQFSNRFSLKNIFFKFTFETQAASVLKCCLI